MKKFLLAVAILCFAPQVFAQMNNFEGFSVAVNANFARAATKLTATAVADYSAYFSDASQNASLQAAYGVAISDSIVLNFGASYSLGDIKSGTETAVGSRAAFKNKDMYAIYFEPGYAATNSTLIYGKIAYIGMKGDFSFPDDNVFIREDFTGTGYGAGIRTMVDKNLFLHAEFMRSDYDRKLSRTSWYEPTALVSTVGLGYKF